MRTGGNFTILRPIFKYYINIPEAHRVDYYLVLGGAFNSVVREPPDGYIGTES